MGEATAEKVVRENTFPLRIFGKKGSKFLCCPYELSYDDLEVWFHEGDPRIVHFRAVSRDNGFMDGGGFKRHFLYSRVGQQHLVTASGYLFAGHVEVYSWKARDFPDQIEDREREAISILPRVEMVHVEGDRKNETGGLDNAVAEHMGRLNGSQTDPLTLEEGMKLYDAMMDHVPRN